MGSSICEIKPTESKTSSVELATIFRSLGLDYIENTNLTLRQQSAFRNITECRTAAKGGHRWHCSSCDHRVTQYNSCFDRHCPKCQGKARYKWVADKMKDVVNTPYFHLVFTLPHELNPLIAFNPKPLLDLLFLAVSQTLLAFGRDPKHLGGELGFISVLHTWSQLLQRHYHLHCIIPGGALSNDGTQWMTGKYESYLFPEFALAQTFRRLYWHGSESPSKEDANTSHCIPVKFKGLKDLLLDGSLKLPPGENQPVSKLIKKLENSLYNKDWVVFAKQAFGGPAQVIKYLGCYTHRVAISNQRIISHAKGKVTFSYKDRKNGYRRLMMTLPEREFASRFLQHVLPTGFMKIRSYGFLANRKKRKRVQQIHDILGKPDLTQFLDQDPVDQTSDEPQIETIPRDNVCPQCKKPTLVYRPIHEATRYLVRKAIWDTS